MSEENVPYFSIIFPIRYITSQVYETLKSITHQTYNDFEIIFVLHPDAFHENAELIKKIPRNLDYAIVKQDYAGLYQAMNLGIEISKGEYLNFIGAGDYFVSPDILFLIKKQIECYPRQQYIWGYGPWFFLDENGDLIYPAKNQHFDTSSLLSTQTPICHQTVFMSRKLILVLGRFDLQYRVAADRDLLDRAARLVAPIIWNHWTVAYIRGGFSTLNSEMGERELEILSNLKSNENYTHRRNRISFKRLKFNCKTKRDIARPFDWLSKELKSFYDS